MEKIYNIKDNKVEILLNTKLYPVIAIKKALSNFTNETYVIMDYEDTNVVKVDLIIKNKEEENIEKIVGELYNELFNEVLRYDISVETKNLRELIVGRALYTTCIDTKTEDEHMNELEDNLDDGDIDVIATNWFDKENDKC